MRIALLLTGHLRTFQHCYATMQKNVRFSPYDVVHTFIETWDTTGHRLDFADVPRDGALADAQYDNTPISVEDIISHDPFYYAINQYRGVDNLIDAQAKKIKDELLRTDGRDLRIKWLFCKYYLIKRLSLAVPEGYDWYVVTRPDFLIQEPLMPHVLEGHLNMVDFQGMSGNLPGFHDNLFVAQWDLYRQFAGLYDHLNSGIFDYFQQRHTRDDLHPFVDMTCGHTVLAAYLKRVFDVPTHGMHLEAKILRKCDVP